MTRAGWLEWRRTGIGGSDVAAIVGLSRFATPMSIYADKVGLTPLDDDIDEYQEFGLMAEPMLGAWYTKRTGLEIRDTQGQHRHPVHDWAICTIDGRTDRGLVEWKTSGWREWDEIPEDYQAQGQWQMYVTGTELVEFGVLHGRRFRIYELARDEADIDFMAAAVDLFWHDHVLAGIAPAADGHAATSGALRAMYPGGGDTVELDPVLVGDWRDAKTQARAAKDDETRLGNLIRAALGDCEVGTVNGQPAVTWRTAKRTTRPRAEESTTTVRTLRVA